METATPEPDQEPGQFPTEDELLARIFPEHNEQ
jgi:hypothetical protein